MKQINTGNGRAVIIRHQMNLKAGMQDNPYHGEHIRDFCEYTDAVVAGAIEDLLNQLPELIRQELDKKEVQIKVDEKSLETAKAKTKSFADILRKMWP